jgi:hypothetical protein
VSNQANAPLDQENRSSGGDYLELAYTQLNNRYAEITDFRAKLLGLLPLATGAGAFLILERTQDQYDELRRFLGPIGIFGLIVTLGLFAYELRGMQRCQKLEQLGEALEEQMHLNGLGPFQGQPERPFGNMLGAPAAGLIIFIATAFAWLWLTAYGFEWPLSLAWGLLSFVTVLALSWVLVWRWLKRTASAKPLSSHTR